MKIKYFFPAILAIIISGCELDRYPMTTLSPVNFWQTEEDLRLALNNNYMHTYIGIGNHHDTQTIDAYGSNQNNVSSGVYVPTNADDVWTRCYQQIRACNNFLENYEKANVTDAVKNRYAGEARFFRAYFYFRLVQRFGDVPYVDKTLDLDSPELFFPRTPRTEVITKILEDIQYAVDNIPEKSGMPAGDVGRITKGAARTLQARVGLYYGTYYKFHGLGGPYRDWLTLAKNAAKAVIDSRQYTLYGNYRDLFMRAGNDNSESIMTLRHQPGSGPSSNRPRSYVFDFNCTPTKHFADAFLCKDGLPIDKSPLFQNYLPLGAEFVNRDPRMAQTIWRPYDPNYQTPPQPHIPNFQNTTRTGYLFKKFAADESPSYTHDMLMRLAEVLVTYAEAAYELDESITDADLDISINTLRKRFASDPDCLPNLTNEFVTANGLNMREEIRRERRVELVSESFRYFDLLRWKTAETELPGRDILGVKLDRDVYPTLDRPLNAEGFVVLQYANTRHFDPGRDYLFPLPLIQLARNENLVQNPKWGNE